VKFGKPIQRALQLLRHRPPSWWRVAINQAAAMARWTYVPCLPVHVTVEPTNLCDQRCPICETGNRTLARPRGSMKLAAYYRLVDQLSQHAHTLMFYFMGEPFLHPDAYLMIQHAKSRGMFVTACTDGNHVNGEALVRSGIDEVSWQLGGATQSTHKMYRVGGRLDHALANLSAAVAEKRRLGVARPQLRLGLIVMRHNEHEIEDFARLAKEVGADACDIVKPCVRNKAEAERFMPTDPTYWQYDKGLFERTGRLRPLVDLRNSCHWIWHSTVITWDGRVLPCCRDPHGQHAMGNVFEQPLSRIWNNPAYRTYRRTILTAQSRVDICKLCSGFGVPDKRGK